MSAKELENLLQSEGVDLDAAEELLAWAMERASELLPGVDGDAELGQLLIAGGEVGPPGTAANESTRSPAARLEMAGAGDGSTADHETTQPRAQLPLPPIPTTTVTEVEEFEELDADELELLDEDDEDEDEEDDSAGVHAGPSGMPSLASGPVGPSGQPIDASAATDADPPAPPEQSAPATADVADAPVPAEAPPERPSFGPPDGTAEVPAWKAALFSAQTGDDGLAAQKVREESTAGRLPEPDPDRNGPAARVGRLVAEEDEISQHSIDLSDLDGDTNRESDARAGTGGHAEEVLDDGAAPTENDRREDTQFDDDDDDDD